MNSGNYNWRNAIPVLAVIVAALIGRALGVGFFILLPGFVIGALIATYLVVKKEAYEKKWVTWLNYSNLVLWLVPPLGGASGIFSLMIAQKKSEQSIKFLVLGLIGLGLALLNAYLGMKTR